MSAFIVEAKSINTLVTYLDHENLSILRLLKVCEDKGEFAQAMSDLNYRAVNHRYNEDVTPPPHTFVPTLFPCQHALYKMLTYYLYQCAEGDIPETSDLYRTLDIVRSNLAYDIISELPDFKAARWA